MSLFSCPNHLFFSQFHETTDMFHNCSLSFVRRWVFLMSEFCCKALRIPLIPGSHCISNADIVSTIIKHYLLPKYETLISFMCRYFFFATCPIFGWSQVCSTKWKKCTIILKFYETSNDLLVTKPVQFFCQPFIL